MGSTERQTDGTPKRRTRPPASLNSSDPIPGARMKPPSQAWLLRTLAELRRESLLDGERQVTREVRRDFLREVGESW
jgi:hypothetical protein